MMKVLKTKNNDIEIIICPFKYNYIIKTNLIPFLRISQFSFNYNGVIGLKV